jgi:hypothetical protein
MEDNQRGRQLRGFLEDDPEGLANVLLVEWRTFSPRLDYVFLGLVVLADRRQPCDLAVLDELIAHAEARRIALISSQARRARGVLRGDAADLETALGAFLEIGMTPFVARARCELGQLRGDAGLIEQGLEDLAALGDVEYAARVVALREASTG